MHAFINICTGSTKMAYLKPSEIYFSQDSISNVFGDRCRHSGIRIGTTLDELCEDRMNISDIPRIRVVKKGERWYSGDNRRLWIFRELERLGKCTDIKVKVIKYIPPQKFTTHNLGESVRVRGDPGGSWHFKTTTSANMKPTQSYRPQTGASIKTSDSDKEETIYYLKKTIEPSSELPRTTTTATATCGNSGLFQSSYMTNDIQFLFIYFIYTIFKEEKHI